MAPRLASLVALTVLAAAGPGRVGACSRLLFTTANRSSVYALRTMDWAFSFDTSLLFFPRGRAGEGGCGAAHRETCKRWTSKYWSVTASVGEWAATQASSFTGRRLSVVDDGVVDGVNEMGLAVHLLFLGSTQYETSRPAPGAVTWPRWAKYLLDMCASVAEARRVMEGREIVVAGVRLLPLNQVMGLHVAVEDSSGDSAIFEVVGGKLQVYPSEGPGFGRDFKVMTNDPAFSEQLRYRDSFIHHDPASEAVRLKCQGGDARFPNRCLPGDVTARDRFVRLSWFSDHASEFGPDGAAKDPETLVSDLRSILFSVAVPHGAPDVDLWDGGVYPTWWYIALDFQRGLYYFQQYRNPGAFYVNFTELGRTETEVRYLSARDRNLVGDATGHFTTPPAQPADPVALRGSKAD